MSYAYALKTAAALAAIGLAVATAAPAEARCARCKVPSKTVTKTQMKQSTVRQVRNVVRYKDVYRIHYYVKVSRTVSRAEFERFKRSCKGACTLAKR